MNITFGNRRIDRIAELLKINRTDIIESTCTAYLKTVEMTYVTPRNFRNSLRSMN
jgi:hypothetical protein